MESPDSLFQHHILCTEIQFPKVYLDNVSITTIFDQFIIDYEPIFNSVDTDYKKSGNRMLNFIIKYFFNTQYRDKIIKKNLTYNGTKSTDISTDTPSPKMFLKMLVDNHPELVNLLKSTCKCLRTKLADFTDNIKKNLSTIPLETVVTWFTMWLAVMQAHHILDSIFEEYALHIIKTFDYQDTRIATYELKNPHGHPCVVLGYYEENNVAWYHMIETSLRALIEEVKANAQPAPTPTQTRKRPRGVEPGDDDMGEEDNDGDGAGIPIKKRNIEIDEESPGTGGTCLSIQPFDFFSNRNKIAEKLNKLPNTPNQLPNLNDTELPTKKKPDSSFTILELKELRATIITELEKLNKFINNHSDFTRMEKLWLSKMIDNYKNTNITKSQSKFNYGRPKKRQRFLSWNQCNALETLLTETGRKTPAQRHSSSARSGGGFRKTKRRKRNLKKTRQKRKRTKKYRKNKTNNKNKKKSVKR